MFEEGLRVDKFESCSRKNQIVEEGLQIRGLALPLVHAKASRTV